jgi:predicted DNA-binding antitoxin AbrB/MazE fold protein
MLTVRAIYQGGELHLLEHVPLKDGEQVEIYILQAETHPDDLTAHLLVEDDFPYVTAVPNADDRAKLDRLMSHSHPSLSEIIIQDRQDGR